MGLREALASYWSWEIYLAHRSWSECAYLFTLNYISSDMYRNYLWIEHIKNTELPNMIMANFWNSKHARILIDKSLFLLYVSYRIAYS